MQKQNNYYRKKYGFTIIEALIVLFIFALITVTFYSIFALGTKYIIESKNKLKATAIASEKIEIIRSLDYNQIGISGSGYISGDIPGFEQLATGGMTFYIFSSVTYIDDSYDGTEDGEPDDDSPTDYKRVLLKVCWENDIDTERSVTMVSDFSPPGVEENIGGGTLVVKVLDKNSNGISQFSINLKNDGLGIDENYITDSNGGVSLPGIDADGNDYEISISKNNYFSIDTLPTYPTSTFYPVYAHVSVTEGRKNIYSITTDKISNVTLKTENTFGSAVQNIAYNLKGGIRKGDTDESPSNPIFYYDQNLDSGSEGENQIEGISYGSYMFAYTGPVANYEFIKMSPCDSNDKNKFVVEPDTDIEEKAIFADKSINSLLVTVLDNSSAQPIKNASVRVYNLSLPDPYDTTVLTDDLGMAFFPVALPELVLGSYDLTVEANGYQNKSETAIISDFVKMDVNLEAN